MLPMQWIRLHRSSGRPGLWASSDYSRHGVSSIKRRRFGFGVDSACVIWATWASGVAAVAAIGATQPAAGLKAKASAQRYR